MTTTQEAPAAKNRTKSPPVPSRSLEDCLADAKLIYTALGHNSFQRPEMASALGVAANSGPTIGRLYSIRAYGLIEASSDGSCKITDLFHKLDNAEKDSAEFKRLALEAVKKNQIFSYLFAEFPTKLPTIQIMAKRLELNRKLPAAKAANIATVYEKCIIFTGVTDASGNILPVREDLNKEKPLDGDSQNPDDLAGPELVKPGAKKNLLKLDIPIADARVITVFYPHDLTGEEAKKAGNVLSAIAGG